MNENKKRAMEELGVDEEFYNEILGDFIKHSEGYLRTLKEGLQADNLENVAKAAHTLRGSSENLRLDKIPQFALAIEIAAKETHDKSVIAEQLIKLREALEELKSSER